MNMIFFGSTTDSVLVLAKLSHIIAVVTQPPKPIGRKHIITPTPVEVWAKKHGITCLTFPTKKDKPWEYESEQVVIDTLQPLKADLLISASYGQKIPSATIQATTHGGLNVHPSLLPRWRGTDPVPWTILSGDHQTGVTIATLTAGFDVGKIIAQKKFPVEPDAETESLRAQLFAEGAALLAHILPDFLSGALQGTTQDETLATYARRLTREDGYVPWEIIEKAIQGVDIPVDSRPKLLGLDTSHISLVITKAIRALSPWPGVWTTWQGKRVKILGAHTQDLTNNLVLDTVQLEGKKPSSHFSP